MRNQKKLISLLIILCLVLSNIIISVYAAPPKSSSTYVKGYYRKDGTYVNGYYRSAHDGNPYNNWSYPGNINPYTGKVAPGDPNSYLNNYPNNNLSLPSPSSTTTSPVIVDNGSYIKQGISMGDVLRIMGAPKEINLNYWTYGSSIIFFDDKGIVTRWSDQGDLKVYKENIYTSSNSVTLGSTKEDVIRIMGAPKQLSDFSWTYGYSSIYFDSKGLVNSWFDLGDLKVFLGDKDPNAKPVTIGSSREDVIKAMGTPKQINSYAWTYGYSSLYFDNNGLVIGWFNLGDLKVFMGDKDPNAKPIMIGSTKEDVIKAYGTPSQVNYISWSYGYSSIYFDNNGRVSSWFDLGDLGINKK